MDDPPQSGPLVGLADAEEPCPFNRAELRVLAGHSRRRAILQCLRSGGELATSELTARVAARRDGVTVGEVPVHRRRRLCVDLCHAHLPRLRSVGLVERDGDRVSPGFGDRRAACIERLEASPVDDEQWEALAVLLGDECRELVVSMLETVAGPASLGDLAIALAARECRDRTGPTEAVDALELSLHHAHLPLLDDVGVVEYDRYRETVVLDQLPGPYAAVRDHSIDVPLP